MKKLLLSLQGVLFLFILAGLILPFIPGCNQTKISLVDNKEIRIILFHINDVHGQIDNFARIAWVVEQEKKKNPRAAVFFLNAGDNFSGNPVVDKYEPRGEPILHLMNRIGCDVMVLGNHDFDYTGIPSTHPVHLQGFNFSDPIATAKKYRYLKKESDSFIALSHLGSRTDALLAQEIKELDLIIGGHSHTQIQHLSETEINGILVAQAGGNARYLGRIELIWQDGQLVKKSGKLIEVASLKEEIPELKNMIAEFNNNHVLNRVIATLPRPAEGILEVGNLTCDAIKGINNLRMLVINIDDGDRTEKSKESIKTIKR